MKGEAIRIPMGADQPIVLDERCEDCEGSGSITVADQQDGTIDQHMCPECEGVGFHPTDAGRAILELVDRYRSESLTRAMRRAAKDELAAHVNSRDHR